MGRENIYRRDNPPQLNLFVFLVIYCKNKKKIDSCCFNIGRNNNFLRGSFLKRPFFFFFLAFAITKTLLWRGNNSLPSLSKYPFFGWRCCGENRAPSILSLNAKSLSHFALSLSLLLFAFSVVVVGYSLFCLTCCSFDAKVNESFNRFFFFFWCSLP